MSVSTHGNEITALIFDPLDDLICGLTIGKLGIRWNIFGLHLDLDFVEVGSVFDDFPADCIRAVGAGGPSVGNMEKNDAAVSEFGQMLDVFNDGAIAGGAVECDQDFVVHGRERGDAAGVYHSPAFIIFLILRFIKSRFRALRWLI